MSLYKVGDQLILFIIQTGFPGGTVVKNPSANAGGPRNAGSIPGLGRSSGVGNSNPLQSYPTLSTLWTVTHQDPLSMGISRQEYLNGLPCYSPEDLPNPGIEHMSLRSPALVGGFFTMSIFKFEDLKRALELTPT